MALTKGRVVSGVKEVRSIFWPGARFIDLDVRNWQGAAGRVSVVGVRVHGTTRERPPDRLQQEQSHCMSLPERAQPPSRCGKRGWRAGLTTCAGRRAAMACPGRGLATSDSWCIPAQEPGQRLTLPRQWTGLTVSVERARGLSRRHSSCRRWRWSTGPWRPTRHWREVANNRPGPRMPPPRETGSRRGSRGAGERAGLGGPEAAPCAEPLADLLGVATGVRLDRLVGDDTTLPDPADLLSYAAGA